MITSIGMGQCVRGSGSGVWYILFMIVINKHARELANSLISALGVSD